MKKLIKYPSQAINLVGKGQFIVMLTTDLDKIAYAFVELASFPVKNHQKSIYFGNSSNFRSFRPNLPFSLKN